MNVVFLSGGAGGSFADPMADLNATDRAYVESLIHSGMISEEDLLAFQAGDLSADDLRQIYGGQVSTGISSQPGTVRGRPSGLAPGPPKTDWGAWLQQNAKWLGFAAVGIVVLPAILSAGRGRRR